MKKLLKFSVELATDVHLKRPLLSVCVYLTVSALRLEPVLVTRHWVKTGEAVLYAAEPADCLTQSTVHLTAILSR